MGCGSAFLKIFSGFLLTVFAIIGIGLVVYGSFSAYLILITNSPHVLRDFSTAVPSLLTIIFGILLIGFVFLGCCGLCRESKCCLETYSAFLILLGLAHLSLGGYSVIIYSNPIENSLGLKVLMEYDMTRDVQNYRNNPKVMDDIQNWMTCCGMRNPTEEYNFGWGQLPHNNELPATCCENGIICHKNSIDRYQNGCAQSVYEFTIGTNIIIGYLSLAVGAGEIIASLLALCLSCCIWRTERTIWR